MKCTSEYRMGTLATDTTDNLQIYQLRARHDLGRSVEGQVRHRNPATFSYVVH
jgi:hypothetical protein